MCRLFSLSLMLILVAVPSLFAQLPAKPALPDSVTLERDVEYGKAGDRALKLDLVLPKAENAKPRPAVVFIHGGAWRGGDKAGGVGAVASLAATGEYVGASVGYRLTGEATWPAQIYDCKAAIRFLKANAKQYGIDPDKIGVFGSSAGGHLVALLGTSGDVKELEGDNGSPGVSSRVACVIDMCGPSDFLVKDIERLPASPAVAALLGGPIAERRDAAKAASPVTYASKDDPPFLIFHGTNDTTVPFDQGQRMHDALQAAGVSSVFVKIEGGGHGIGGPEVQQRIKAFFDKHLRGKDATVSGEPISARPR